MHHDLESLADPDAVARAGVRLGAARARCSDRNLAHLHKALRLAPAQVRAMSVNKTDLAAAAATSRPRCPSTSIWSTWV